MPTPAEWDPSKQRAINSKKYPHNSELNIWLDKVDSEIKSVFRSLNIDNLSPTPEVIKERINEKLFNKVNSKIPSLLSFIDSYIQECARIKNPNTVRTYVRTYVTTYKHLQSYARLNRIHLDYTSITLNFYNSFINYLMHDLNLSQNTIGKHIQVFKTFMNEATDRGYNKKLEFRGRKFKRLAVVKGDNSLKDISKLIFSDIAYFQFLREGKCRASYNHFAKKYGKSNGTISKAVSELESKGYIERYLDDCNQIGQMWSDCPAFVPLARDFILFH